MSAKTVMKPVRNFSIVIAFLFLAASGLLRFANDYSTVMTKVMSQAWSVLTEMAPYLLLGFLIAGLLSVFVSQETVEKQLGKKGIASVLKASLFGIPLPLCSCGVIPVSASLRRHGASKGAATSFLLSTPQTGVDSIAVTWSLLGPVFTIFRPLFALVTGVAGGMAVNALDPDTSLDSQAAPVYTDECCSPDLKKTGRIARALRYGFVTLPKDIGRAMLGGIVLAGLIGAFVPDNFFSGSLGLGIAGILVMMAAGIPLYVCATASVPIAAALIVKGASPGAAFAFLMTGPATNAATIATIWKVMGRKTAVIYLGTVATAAVIGGLVLNAIVPESSISILQPGRDTMSGGLVASLWGFCLLGVLGYAMWGAPKQDHDHKHASAASLENPDISSIVFTVDGMTCEHCSMNIKRACEETPGVLSAVVDLENDTATVSGPSLDAKMIVKNIEGLGYSVKPRPGAGS